MKKIIIGTIIVAVIGGGYALANDSYTTKVEDALSTITENLVETGYIVNYENVKSNILNEYISIEGLTLEKEGEVITLDSFKINRDSFGDASNEKPKMIEFSIDNLKVPKKYKEDGVFDVYYTYNYNDIKNNFISKLSIKNEKSADVSISLELKNADILWGCMNTTVESCKLSMEPESLNNFLGSVSLSNLDISFKNNGVIQNKISNLYGEGFEIKDIQRFAIETIKNANIKNENREVLNNFINNLDKININLKQKNNEDVKNIILKFVENINKGTFNTEQDIAEFLLGQFDIIVK